MATQRKTQGTQGKTTQKTKGTKTTEPPDTGVPSSSSCSSPSSLSDTFIPPHGGYEKLLSFQKARIVYAGTVHFCKRFLDSRDRTCDQMIQAARSGKQNI